MFFFFNKTSDTRDLHFRPPPFPTPRSSDLICMPAHACTYAVRQHGFTQTAGQSRAGMRRSFDQRRKAKRDQQATLDPQLDMAPNRLGLGLYQIGRRSEEHTSELPSLMRISYAVFCL